MKEKFAFNFQGKIYQRKVYFQIRKLSYATLNDIWGQNSSNENLCLYNVIIQSLDTIGF